MAQNATSAPDGWRCLGACALVLPAGDFYLKKSGKYAGRRAYGKCKECMRALQRDYRADNLAQEVKRSHDYHQSNRSELLAKMRVRNRKIKMTVMRSYGGEPPTCACCGEGEQMFLAIDHVDGGGNKQRKRLGVQSGTQFYRWLIKHGFPSGYRVLCHNCNLGRSLNGGICPHENPEG